MKRLFRFDLIFPAAGIILFLLFPAPAAEGARTGLKLCGEVLIPSLFPLSVLVCCAVRTGLSNWLSAKPFQWLGRLLGLSEAGLLPVILGLAGGFPLGAQLLAEQFKLGSLTEEEAVRCSALCNNAGPAFLLAVLGHQVFGSVPVGLALFFIQFLSLSFTGCLFQLRTPIPRRSAMDRIESRKRFSAAFPEALGISAAAMLRITGTVVFFSALLSCLKAFLPLAALPAACQTLLWGSIELSGSVSFLGKLPIWQAFPLASALSSWGGLCVHMQAIQFLSEVRLPLRVYLTGKLLQAFFSAALSCSLLLARAGTLLFLLPIFLILMIFLLSCRFWKKFHWKTGKAVV